MGESSWFAHTPPYKGGPWHTVGEHSTGVLDLATGFARPLGLEPEAHIAATLHDLGKLGILFQRRLEGHESGIDHWTVGAWVAVSRCGCPEAAVAIHGHHIGMQSGAKAFLRELDPKRYVASDANPRRLSEGDADLLLGRWTELGFSLPAAQLDRPKHSKAPAMLRNRMLFSTLVDADFLDTESHFARRDHGPKRLRQTGPELDVDRCLKALDDYRSRLKNRAIAPVQRLREEVFQACTVAAEEPIGLFTLTAPTGSGKTLAMLRFALLHAKRHGLRRIIVVLPYLTLIEQTAEIYREVFKDFDPNFVLEDHSLAREEDPEDEGHRAETKLLAENWDAPVVITTNVRFFEALHHNRPSVCRKLHRIAQSVVLCDEVQTLPLDVKDPTDPKRSLNLVTPTLATLASLSADFGATVVFATATQPAFGALSSAVEEMGKSEWKPREILPQVAACFSASARVRTEWRFEPQSWPDLAEEVADLPGTLVIVNTRRDAARLAEILRDVRPDAPIRHLSTNMCIAHRRQTLEWVRSNGVESKGFLVATQCVEAGVDLDFSHVYRAWAPLDSIAQAAGRCNRNGNLNSGQVVVFLPEDAKYPPGYEQAKQAAAGVVTERGPAEAELHDPELFRAYFRRLYLAKGTATTQDLLGEAIASQNFALVADLYRLIPESGINVVVRIGDALGSDHEAKNAELLNELEQDGLSGKMMRRLRPYTVGAFPSQTSRLPLEPLKTRRGDPIPNWFLMNNPANYDPLVGLLSDESAGALIA